MGAKMSHIRHSDQRMIQAASSGDAIVLAQVLADGDPETQSKSFALERAAENGHEQCVRLLIPKSDPLDNDSRALALAALEGHVECVKLLIPVSDPLAQSSAALRGAAKSNRKECVQLLIPVSDPQALNSQALRSSALRGHSECVRVLLPVSDCDARWDDGLSVAARARKTGHALVADMIDAFIEAKTLATELSGELIKPSQKRSL